MNLYILKFKKDSTEYVYALAENLSGIQNFCTFSKCPDWDTEMIASEFVSSGYNGDSKSKKLLDLSKDSQTSQYIKLSLEKSLKKSQKK